MEAMIDREPLTVIASAKGWIRAMKGHVDLASADAVKFKEGDGLIEEYADTTGLDAGLISSAQAVEHYEITRYGTLRRWAKVLGLKDAVKLLEKSLKEESQTDEDLTALADAEVNARAATVTKPKR